MATQPFGLGTLVLALLSSILCSLGVASFVAALGYYRLGYGFGPQELIVRSAEGVETVPLGEIEGIYAGQRVGPLRRVRGFNWPGYHLGTMRTRSLGSTRVYCTDREVEGLSVIVCASRTLILSPDDPPAFRRELVRRIEAAEGGEHLGPIRPLGTGLVLPSPASAALGACALSLLLTTVLALILRSGGLPELVPLQVDPSGQQPVLSPRNSVSSLPLIGAVILVLNVVLTAILARRERAAGFVLLATAATAQLFVLIATLRLLP